MNINHKFKLFIILSIISLGLVSVATAQEDSEIAQNLRWLEKNVEELNTEVKDINVGFEYDLESLNCIYTYAQNPYGNEITTEYKYEFNIQDLGEVKRTDDGILLQTKNAKPLIHLTATNNYDEAPEVKEEKIPRFIMFSGNQPDRLLAVWEETIKMTD